jgi:type IV secretion system protein VirD4
MAPPTLTKADDRRPDDWSSRPLPPRPSALAAPTDDQADDEDPKTADRRRHPELDQEMAEKKASPDNEFVADLADEFDDDAPRIRRMNDMMQGVARQASLDPGDDLGL